MKVVLVIIPIVVGVALLIYGVGFHGRTVHFDEEVEIEAPPIEEDPFFGGVDEPPADPSPEAASETVTVLEERETVEPEHSLVLEVTRGGVERLADGRIKRTYIAGAGPPALCPT